MNTKKLYILGVALFLGLTSYGILRMDYSPQPVGIMKPSAFDRPVEIGAVLFRRLFVPLAEKHLVVFGVTPSEPAHREVVEGFVLAAAAEGRPVHVVFQEEGLEPLKLPAGVESFAVKFNSSPAALADQVRAHTQSGRRVLIYTASVLSSHLVDNNPIHRFEQFWGEPVFAISTVGITVRREQKPVADPPCVGSERDGTGTRELGCAALLKSRALFRKNLETERFVALLEQRGVSDLLLFVSKPDPASKG